MEQNKKQKIKMSVFVSEEIATAMRVQAARLGISKSEFVTLAFTNPKKLEALQDTKQGIGHES
jgi:hypothetical protein